MGAGGGSNTESQFSSVKLKSSETALSVTSDRLCSSHELTNMNFLAQKAASSGRQAIEKSRQVAKGLILGSGTEPLARLMIYLKHFKGQSQWTAEDKSDKSSLEDRKHSVTFLQQGNWTISCLRGRNTVSSTIPYRDNQKHWVCDETLQLSQDSLMGLRHGTGMKPEVLLEGKQRYELRVHTGGPVKESHTQHQVEDSLTSSKTWLCPKRSHDLLLLISL